MNTTANCITLTGLTDAVEKAKDILYTVITKTHTDIFCTSLYGHVEAYCIYVYIFMYYRYVFFQPHFCMFVDYPKSWLDSNVLNSHVVLFVPLSPLDEEYKRVEALFLEACSRTKKVKKVSVRYHINAVF